LFAPVLAKFSKIAVQNQNYADRFIALGANPDRVKVTGSMKFTAIRQAPEIPPELAQIMVPFSKDSRVIVAGSTHAGEETAVLGAFGSLYRQHDDLKLLLAPRHLERIAEVENEVRDTGLSYVLRSRVDSFAAEFPAVMILDTHGELSSAYKYATLAFVGGSLEPIGGHNVLEPARFGVPVLYGPFVDNFMDEVSLLERSKGGAMVADAGSMAVVIHELLLDPDQIREKGKAAKNALDDVSGVLTATYDWISSGTAPA
jgi:3-deoxy-D-manno-octulosonic-acid transferase